MNKMQITTRALALLMLVFTLVGCSAPTVVVPPTQDIPAVRTEAAQTVVAKITIEAALNPTATTAPTQAPPEPIVITATVEPNPTATATPASAVQATATQAPTATATRRPVTGGNPAPTRTTRPGPDLGQFVSQEPTDGANFKAGTIFDGKWTIKNIGTSTWTTDYDYRFAGGTNLAEKDRFTLPKSVAPGQSITIIVDMVAPSTAGRYTSRWELINENGEEFFDFFLVIDVTE